LKQNKLDFTQHNKLVIEQDHQQDYTKTGGPRCKITCSNIGQFFGIGAICPENI